MSVPQVQAQRDIPVARPETIVTEPPRKRRKRAPAAGAAADCFTCASRTVKCDRRRPYCSQCLDDGKECSGYKTQLTWGNGVASRGKLRGLSLPIAGTQKLALPISPTKSKRRPSQSQFAHQPVSQHTAISPLEVLSTVAPLPSPISNARPDVPFQFEQSHSQLPPLSSPYVGSTTTWPQPSANNAIKVETREYSYPTPASASITSSQDGLLFGTASTGGIVFGGAEQLSPLPYSAPSPDSAYFGRILSHTSTSVPPPIHGYPASQVSATSDTVFRDHGPFAPYTSKEEAYISNEVYTPSHSGPQVDTVLEHDNVYPGEELEQIIRSDYEDECAIVEDDSSAQFPHMSLVRFNMPISSFAASEGIGATPRMQYLINYYAEVIAPVIVAFDGPSNPYRTHILRLALKSETLQHAIAALAASNLRQRRETGLSTCKTDPARRSSMAHLTLTHEPWHDTGLLSPQEQAREESLHKGVAIQSLNKQLAHPVLRKDDSTLATLLILCLFHICDSGVAKFQTQFAGVKKLLSLRRNDPGFNTKEAKWFTRMFTWFDAMTATVNDREGQLQGYHLDVSALSDEEWALENLAGCDGQLFKTIAKLGRLNVLSQGNAVEEVATIVSRPPQNPLAPNLDYNKFDGNGWMRMIEDDNLFTRKAAESDVKSQFWREWREIRQTLMTWHLDTTVFDSSSSEAPYLTYEQRLDLSNISESFRYSALLYTERLANPNIPSTEPVIWNWVQECLKYIKAVKSDVYLLWPLFITGSECVDDEDREVIRQRCLDIQKDSGFLNNKSCLELLEKVWRNYDEKKRTSPVENGDTNDAQTGHDHESGFRFTTIMKRENNEGEYIVV